MTTERYAYCHLHDLHDKYTVLFQPIYLAYLSFNTISRR